MATLCWASFSAIFPTVLFTLCFLCHILIILATFQTFWLLLLFLFIYLFIFIGWSLITSQHFHGCCHTLTCISHGVTCIPHPDPPPPLSPPDSSGSSQCTRPEHLSHASAGKDWRREEMGTTKDGMIGWHHRLDGHEFEQALGVDDGQGSLQSIGLQRVGHD